MGVSKKELIVSFFINVILMLITFSCLYILKGDFVSICLACVEFIYVFLSSILIWNMMKTMRLNEENK